MTKVRHLGRRFLSFALCLVSVLVLALPAAAYHVPNQNVASGRVEETPQAMACIVYSAASAGTTPIGYFEDGAQITVKSEKKNYYQIDCYGMTGYIAKSQVIHTADGQYYVNCIAGARDTKLLDYVDVSELLTLRHSILRLTQKQLGSRYVYGGARPGAFDCSGLVRYVYGKHAYDLAHGSTKQLSTGIIVAKESMQLGDLVFFREKGASTLTTHVGIYVGNNQIIHSGSKGVRYADLDGAYFSNYYVGARRVINTAPIRIEAVPTVSMETAAVCVRSVSN